MIDQSDISADRSVRKHVVWGAATVLLLFVGIGGWAATTEISGAVVTSGLLVVESDVKKVQHPTGGVIGEIRVKDGMTVREGDVVIRLDETVTLKGLSYIVATDEACQMTVEEKGASPIPDCARIAGFQIFADQPGTVAKDGYSLLCESRLLQSAGGGVRLGRLPTPLTFQVQFTTGETTWVDPKDKAETVYENLRLTQGDRVSPGGEVKGSTFGSSTTFGGPFEATGMGTVSWGYAKPLKAHTVTVGPQTYLCEMKSERAQ